MKKIYVGNLAYNTGEEQLRELFAEYGTLESVTVITDRMTGRSRGFAFVEMPDDAEAAAAISALNAKEIDGRALNVSEARPREGRSGGGGGGGRGGFGGGGGRRR